jgi:hypothetical protein
MRLRPRRPVDYGESAMVDRYLGRWRRQSRIFEDTSSDTGTKRYTYVDTPLPAPSSADIFLPGEDSEPVSRRRRHRTPKKHREIPEDISRPTIAPFLYNQWVAAPPTQIIYPVGSYLYAEYDKFKKNKKKKRKKIIQVKQTVIQRASDGRQSKSHSSTRFIVV